MRKRRLLAISIILLLSITARAATPSAQQLQRANKAYQAGDFAEALTQYEALVEEGYRSEALYYNLANSYYRTNKIGKAILFYERALMLDPNDSDIRHNLQVAQSHLQDEIEALPTFFLTKWINNLTLEFATNTWTILALISLWVGIAGLAVWILSKVRRTKKIGFTAGVILISLSFIAFAIANYRSQLDQDSRRAVVMQPKVALHSAPDTQSTVVIEVHEGITVSLLDKIGEWYKVSLPNGEEGWLPQNSFERI
ncbi:MAG: tetratricopeptide repeat protein [Saprospiraceae bacterium]|nr:tetratricopeptide repeat protein [Saprospiraceae bacterium]